MYGENVCAYNMPVNNQLDSLVQCIFNLVQQTVPGDAKTLLYIIIILTKSSERTLAGVQWITSSKLEVSINVMSYEERWEVPGCSRKIRFRCRGISDVIHGKNEANIGIWWIYPTEQRLTLLRWPCEVWQRELEPLFYLFVQFCLSIFVPQLHRKYSNMLTRKSVSLCHQWINHYTILHTLFKISFLLWTG